ncbi:hypothetical protein [Candidatus Stoquefichus massiliensis]|uniref:hypothetical protein n=1 Tax=Candidatus Stoquefichus massiliensis TaxID=1470350 RepID=UPI0004815202|nr:hypothetical protein [Candidatus Stoquefichus massiliensis]
MVNKLRPKKITRIVYNCLILIVTILTIIRWISAFNNEIVVINAEINSHISNFALSLVFYLGVGYTWILQKITLKKIILLGLFIIIANIICETVMGFMNTTDIIDATYGIVGTLLGFCYLLVVNKYGLEIIHDEN